MAGREALVGESKNDDREAWALGEALRLHHARWKPLAREADLTRKLQVLTRDEQGFIAQMNQLTNQVQHALGQYYPQALELFSDWTSPSSWDFVLQFPTPQAFQAATCPATAGCRTFSTCIAWPNPSGWRRGRKFMSAPVSGRCPTS
ncbi:MAG: transposase [Verrucomicrobia bacterium]|nr:transposase [Verrucomicrobiota bacterium]